MIRIPYDVLVALAETGPEAPRPAPAPAFVVWYLRGRGKYGAWNDTMRFPEAEAWSVALDIERGGRPCVVLPHGAPAPTTMDPAWWNFGWRFGDNPRLAGRPGEDVPPAA